MPRTIRYAQLPTERPLPASRSLDQHSVEGVLRLMNRQDRTVPRAVAAAIPQIADTVRLIVNALRAGGRLWFIGAGTSGRLGVIEAAECPPTFNTPPELVRAMIAGGPNAVFTSIEGAEDQESSAKQAVTRHVRRGDVVVGIAASGVTPFVLAGLRAAHARGARTILVTCHATLTSAPSIDVAIRAPVGPEVLTGSTRLKAGTATKLILNMLTVASMTRLGKVYGHWMVDVRPTSRKLRARALRIVETLAGVPTARATELLRAADDHVKPAIVMGARGVDLAEAQRLLAEHHGHLRPLLSGNPRSKTRASRQAARVDAAS